MKKFTFLLSFIALLTTSVQSQTLIHYWHFNNVNGTVDSVAADVHASANAPFIVYQESFPGVVNKGYMDDVNGDALNARNTEPAGNGIRPRNPSDSMELYIQLPSTGFEDLHITYAVQRSGSGMLKEVLYYTTDGVNYTPHQDTVFVTTTYALAYFDLSSITGINNNPNFAVKIRFFEQNIASNGNNRIDNFVLEGNSLGGSVDSVSLNKNTLSLLTGTNEQLIATVLPASATNKNVTWTSTNTSVASVDSTGLVNALSVGNAEIIVTTVDGGFSDTCVLTVSNPATLTILVKSGTNLLDSAQVDVDGDIKFTNASGEVDYNLMPNTQVNVSVSKNDYSNASLQFTVLADTTVEVELNALAQVIHYWHFNDIPADTINSVNADYTLSPNKWPAITYEGTGSGYMDEYSPGSAFNSKFSHPAGKALRVRNRSHEKALIIPLPADSCEDIVLSFAVHRSGSGMLVNKFEYTLDGTSYQNMGISPQQITITEDYVLHTIDFSAVTGANNNINFGVRITWEGNTEQENGNNRYDNIAMTAKTQKVVSVNNLSKTESNLQVYPNPTTGLVFVDGVNTRAECMIYSISGAVVYTTTLQAGQNTIELPSNLNNGLYIISVLQNNTVVNKKLQLAK